MKHKLFSVFFFLSFVFIGLNMMTTSSSAEEERCTRDGGALKVKDTLAAKSFTILGTDTAADNCTEEPKFYKMIGHKIALCTADPYTANGAAAPNLTSCTATLVESSAGAEIIIEPGVETNLLAGAGELFIPINSYTHAVLIASNHLYIKHSETYKKGGNAYTMAGYGASAYSTGTTCYSTDRNSATAVNTTYSNTPTSGSSNGITSISETKVTSEGNTENVVKPATDDSTSLTLACADTIPTTGANRFGYVGEIIDSLNDRVNGTTNCDDQEEGDSALRCSNTFGKYENYAGTEEYAGVQGQAAFNLVKNDLTLADNRNEVRKIVYMVKFERPLRITENTTSFKINVSTTSSVSVDSHWDTGEASGRVQAAKYGANPFSVQFLTKTKRRRGAWN